MKTRWERTVAVMRSALEVLVVLAVLAGMVLLASTAWAGAAVATAVPIASATSAKATTAPAFSNANMLLFELSLPPSHSKWFRAKNCSCYIVQAVRQGRYQARIAYAQLAKSGLLSDKKTAVEIGADGSFVNGLALTVRSTAPS